MTTTYLSRESRRDLRERENLLRYEMNTLSNLLANAGKKNHGVYSRGFTRSIQKVAPSARKLSDLMNNTFHTATQFMQKSPVVLSAYLLALNNSMQRVDALYHSHEKYSTGIDEKTKKQDPEIQFLETLTYLWDKIKEKYKELMEEGFSSAHWLEAAKDTAKPIELSDCKSIKKQMQAFLKNADHLITPMAARSAHESMFPELFLGEHNSEIDGSRANYLINYLNTIRGELNPKRLASFIDRVSTAGAAFDGKNTLKPEVEAPLLLDKSQHNPPSDNDSYDVNVIVLTERSVKLNEQAANLREKYPSKTIVINMQGSVVGEDMHQYTERLSKLTPQSSIKLQILGDGRYEIPPSTVTEEAPSKPTRAHEPDRSVSDTGHLDGQVGGAHELDRQVGAVDEPPLPGTSHDSPKEELTIGHYSAEQLGFLVPHILRNNLCLNIADKYVRASFVTSAPKGTSDGKTSLEKNFVTTFADAMRDTHLASLYDHEVTIHTMPIEVKPDGKKVVLVDPHDNEPADKLSDNGEFGSKGSITGGTPASTNTEKLRYSFTASILEPLGMTPEHYGTVKFTDYTAKMPDSAYIPNPDDLEICVIPKVDYEHWKEISEKREKSGQLPLLDFSLQASSNYHNNPCHALYVVCDNKSRKEGINFKFLARTGSEIRDLTEDEARDLLDEAFRNSTEVGNRFDVTLRGDVRDPWLVRGNRPKISEMSANEWAEILVKLFEKMGVTDKRIHHLFIRAPQIVIATPRVTEKVQALPVFPNKLARALKKHGYIDRKTIIGGNILDDNSTPTIPNPTNPHHRNHNFSSFVTVTPADKRRLHSSRNLSWEDIPIRDKMARIFYVTVGERKVQLGSMSDYDDKVVDLCTKNKHISFAEVLNIGKSKIKCSTEVAGSMFYYCVPDRSEASDDMTGKNPADVEWEDWDMATNQDLPPKHLPALSTEHRNFE